MPNITLKGVPDGLYKELKRRAAAERRSLNSEAIVCLERGIGDSRGPIVDPVAFTAQVRALRERYNIQPFTDDELTRIKHEGRP